MAGSKKIVCNSAKKDQRLEGTFVNSEGGWGSISGKRTAGCVP